jgi:hypothetical protein
MALDLHEQVEQALLEVLHGGWAKYLELEDGTQVRAVWHSGEDGNPLEYLEITHTETGHKARLAVAVTATLLELPLTPAAEREPEPVVEREVSWCTLTEGDQAKGGDGVYYPVVKATAGGGPNEGKTMVTLLIGRVEKVYPMPPQGLVWARRGPTGLAVQALLDAGLGPEVIKS